MYWRVTEDKISEQSRKGWIVGTYTDARNLFTATYLDDDRIHYYTAVVDDEGLEAFFDWAQRDSGVTIARVKGKDVIG